MGLLNIFSLEHLNWHLDFSSRHLVSAQHLNTQTISPQKSALYQAATDDTSSARCGSNLHPLNSSVSIYTPNQETPSYKCKYMCILKICQAITESVGLATVTNTSQPLKRQRPRHLQCLLKTLWKNTTQKRPINSKKKKKTERKTMRKQSVWQARLWKSQLVSSST